MPMSGHNEKLIEQPAIMATIGASSSPATAASRIVERYDRLLEKLGEDPFQPSALWQRTEDAGTTIDAITVEAERKQLIKVATEKSQRCVELMEQALEASEKLSHVQEKLTNAYKYQQSNGDNDGDDDDDSDDDVDMNEESKEEETKTALLLEDLVAVADEVQEMGKKYAHLGVISKTARASRALLSTAEQNLKESMDVLNGTTDKRNTIEDDFRDLYMEEFTSAFGDELDHFRHEERFESKDVTYLISCIHAGGDIFTPLQKKLFVESVNASKT